LAEVPATVAILQEQTGRVGLTNQLPELSPIRLEWLVLMAAFIQSQQYLPSFLVDIISGQR